MAIYMAIFGDALDFQWLLWSLKWNSQKTLTGVEEAHLY